jgi:hypothetical protein
MGDSWIVSNVTLVEAVTGETRAGQMYRARLASSEGTFDVTQFVTEDAMGVIADSIGVPRLAIARHEILVLAVEEFLLTELHSGWNLGKTPPQELDARGAKLLCLHSARLRYYPRTRAS